jgi:hypothetical protein
MPTTIYDSSLITKRKQNTTIANSFISRIQNGNNSTTGSAPILGITGQSIINSVKTGQMVDYRKNEGGCTIINRGCPCSQANSPVISAIRGWVTSIGGIGLNIGNSITIDSSGNIYVTGIYSISSITINNFVSDLDTPGGAINVTPYGTLSNSSTSQEAFIVKYTTNGLVQWATSIVGAAGADSLNNIATDSSGNVYVTGTNRSSPLTINSFSSNPVTPGGAINLTAYGTLSTSGISDAYIVKYTTSGLVQWATTIRGSNSEVGYDIATDSSGNVYVTGYYRSSPLTINSFSSNPVTPGGAINVTSYGTLLSTSGTFDVYIVKYTTNGLVQWATSIRGSGDEIEPFIATDSSGNIYVTGNYSSSSLTINSFSSNPVTPGGAINLTAYGKLSNSGGDDAYIVKYTTSGLVQWATSIGGGGEIGYDIATDSSGNVYVTGNYSSSSLTINSFSSNPVTPGDPINLTAYGTLSNSGVFNAYIVKYTTNGLVQWATSIGGAGDNQGRGITTDSSGNVYVTGNYSSSPLTINSFSSNPVTPGDPINLTAYGTLLSTSGTFDVYIVKYTTNGLVQWATSIGGANNDTGRGISTDSSGNVYVTGNYSSSPLTINSFSSNPVTPGDPINVALYGKLSNSGVFNAYIVKYTTNGQIIYF